MGLTLTLLQSTSWLLTEPWIPSVVDLARQYKLTGKLVEAWSRGVIVASAWFVANFEPWTSCSYSMAWRKSLRRQFRTAAEVF